MCEQHLYHAFGQFLNSPSFGEPAGARWPCMGMYVHEVIGFSCPAPVCYSYPTGTHRIGDRYMLAWPQAHNVTQHCFVSARPGPRSPQPVAPTPRRTQRNITLFRSVQFHRRCACMQVQYGLLVASSVKAEAEGLCQAAADQQRQDTTSARCNPDASPRWRSHPAVMECFT